jgi:hypothetical protein
MNFTEFVRKPFKIEAEQITNENMDEVCELIGHEVRTQGESRYIVVNRRIVPNGYRAYAGWWITQMGDNFRCYPKRVFEDQFVPMSDEWATWFEDAPEEDLVGSVVTQDSITADNIAHTETVVVDSYRDAITGEYVSKEYADQNPETTVHERNEVEVDSEEVADATPKDTFVEETVDPYQ